MKILKILLFFGIVSIFFLSHSPNIVSAQAGSERILDFNSQIDIREDGKLVVKETITVQAYGNQIKRGIFRDYPTSYKNVLGFYSSVPFNVIEVKRNGVNDNYHFEQIDFGTRLYIGDENVFLQPGVYKYELTYLTDHQLGFFDNHDELFYNITGNGWNFPIDKVSAQIRLPQGINASDIEAFAYTGIEGAKGQDYQVRIISQDPIIASFETTRPLRLYEGLSVVLEFPKGFVTEPTIIETSERFLADNFLLLGSIVLSFVFVAYALITWLMAGIDPKGKVIIPEFSPPKDMSPSLMRYIERMQIDNENFSVALISMAVKGYIRIEESGDTYKIKKLDEAKYDQLATEEKAIADNLLAKKDSFVFKNKDYMKVLTAKSDMTHVLDTTDGERLVIMNKKLVYVAYAIAILIIATSVFLHHLNGKNDIGLFSAIFIVIGSSFTFYTWINLKNKIGLLLNKFSCLRLLQIIAIAIAALFATLILVVVLIAAFYYLGIISVIQIALTFFITVWYTQAIKVRSKLGKELHDKILGFKMFLTATETERLRIMHKTLPKTIETYERYLPFAIALGISAQWAAQFESVIKEAAKNATNGTYSPLWYYGTSFNPGGSFSSAISSSISSSATAPGSVSGGSGGSGGGGGGGGGGGW
ncbi:MAG: DUF2207 domain-containing protein [Candidatus Dojkabacteria bacterium]|uniref:DUF2207 domain-containing protein n=1 Tax=Candidatus Dojkabacteria bacterium TaxID=2099670 RepID=A0A952AHN6_9BACT|nr:DUF2207 domain-containing protein [Candidatus Dojkabacteria bacterium]WKZ28062.1 MAG: DUF2207 domain-containing protein [Candidatus Dojkabacteria bacterium]